MATEEYLRIGPTVRAGCLGSPTDLTIGEFIQITRGERSHAKRFAVGVEPADEAALSGG